MPHSERKLSQIAKLISSLTSIVFFNNILREKGLDSFTKCCTSLQLLSIPAGEYIFHYGDKGNFFCIILQGKVLLPKKGETGLTFSRVTELGPGSTFGRFRL